MLTAVGIAWLLVTLLLTPSLQRRRRSAKQRRHAAELRVALLETARSLPGHDLPEAARLACEGLRTLGFDAAAVGVRRGRAMRPMYAVGLPRIEQPVPADGSFAGRCLDENRTLVIRDYASLPAPIPERAQLRSIVLTPIRVDGRPVATLTAARLRVDEPTAQEIAIAETVATHLGRAFTTEARLSAQADLLARMRRLERMRTAFVEDVSEELHDRLRTLRDLAEALAGGELGDERRTSLLADVAGHAEALAATIDTLLDFSRFQADRPEPVLAPIAVSDLLAPPLDRSEPSGPTGDRPDDTYVRVDADLVRHGLELLLAGGPDEAPIVQEQPGHVVLVLGSPAPDGSWPRGGLASSLAQQLLLAGGANLRVGQEIAVELPRWVAP